MKVCRLFPATSTPGVLGLVWLLLLSIIRGAQGSTLDSSFVDSIQETNEGIIPENQRRMAQEFLIPSSLWQIPQNNGPIVFPFDKARVGDSIRFEWSRTHEVWIHPTGTCDTTNRTLVGLASGATYIIPESDAGQELTFACDFNNGVHCNLGMIMTVTVADLLDEATPTPEPTDAPSTVSTSNSPSSTTSSPDPTACPGTPPVSYQEVPVCPLCYFSSPLTWNMAEIVATKLGCNLASVETIGERLEFALEMEQGIQSRKFWTGGKYIAASNEWMWTDGTPFSGKHWGTNQPNGLSEYGITSGTIAYAAIGADSDGNTILFDESGSAPFPSLLECCGGCPKKYAGSNGGGGNNSPSASPTTKIESPTAAPSDGSTSTSPPTTASPTSSSPTRPLPTSLPTNPPTLTLCRTKLQFESILTDGAGVNIALDVPAYNYAGGNATLLVEATGDLDGSTEFYDVAIESEFVTGQFTVLGQIGTGNAARQCDGNFYGSEFNIPPSTVTNAVADNQFQVIADASSDVNILSTQCTSGARAQLTYQCFVACDPDTEIAIEISRGVIECVSAPTASPTSAPVTSTPTTSPSARPTATASPTVTTCQTELQTQTLLSSGGVLTFEFDSIIPSNVASGDATVLVEVTGDVDGSSESYTVLAEDGVTLGRVGNTGAEGQCDGNYYGSRFPVNETAFSSWLSNNLVTITADADFQVGSTVCGTGTPSGARAQIVYPCFVSCDLPLIPVEVSRGVIECVSSPTSSPSASPTTAPSARPSLSPTGAPSVSNAPTGTICTTEQQTKALLLTGDSIVFDFGIPSFNVVADGGDATILVEVTGDVDGASETYTVLSEDGSVLGEVGNAGPFSAQCDGNYYGSSFAVDGPAFAGWVSDDFVQVTTQADFSVSPTIGDCGSTAPSGARVQISYPCVVACNPAFELPVQTAPGVVECATAPTSSPTIETPKCTTELQSQRLLSTGELLSFDFDVPTFNYAGGPAKVYVEVSGDVDSSSELYDVSIGPSLQFLGSVPSPTGGSVGQCDGVYYGSTFEVAESDFSTPLFQIIADASADVSTTLCGDGTPSGVRARVTYNCFADCDFNTEMPVEVTPGVVECVPLLLSEAPSMLPSLNPV